MVQVNFKILKKMFLCISIYLKLTSGAVVSPDTLIKILLWLCLSISWSLGVCSIRNSEKHGQSLLCTLVVVHDMIFKNQ